MSTAVFAAFSDLDAAVLVVFAARASVVGFAGLSIWCEARPEIKERVPARGTMYKKKLGSSSRKSLVL